MIFRRRRRDPLAGIDETTPHRFAIAIPDPEHMARARVALDSLAGELTVQATGDQLVIASTKSPRNAAVLRPLTALQRSGVVVAGFEFLDVIAVADRAALTDVISTWRRDANRGPARRRAESIGGTAALDELHRIVATAKPDMRGAASFVFKCAAFNTPGSEHGVVALAARAPGASEMIGWALDRCRVAELTNTPAVFDEADLLTIVRAGGYSAERALGLVAALPTPLRPEWRDELIELAEGDGELAAEAVSLLDRADPDAELRATLDRLIEDAPSRVRAEALAAASRLWGSELRPVWHAWLGERSAPLRESAEEVIGAYGDADDLGVATAHLAKLIRRRPGQVSWHAPREAPLIELLLRHRGEERVEAAFDDLYERWNRLNPDIHDWLRREHPDLVSEAGPDLLPDGGPDRDGDDRADDLAADDAMWPLPSITVADGTVTVWFEQTDMFETKDRFEELCAAHPAVEIAEAHREVLHLAIDDPDPVAVVTRLWADAGGDPSP